MMTAVLARNTGGASPRPRASIDEQMAGLPLLNQALGVATLGFREHAGRWACW